MYALKTPGSGRIHTFTTRDSLIEFWATNPQTVPKPPASWMEEQRKKGRSDTAAASIWYRRYPSGDRIAIWMQATDDDFWRAGYAL